MATLIDSYSESNHDDWTALGASYFAGTGQSFTSLVSGEPLDLAKFYLYKQASATGNAYVKIYAHSGTWGSTGVPGSLLATSDAFDVSTLTAYTPTLASIIFSGANKITLDTSTHYIVTFEYGGGDASNYILVGKDGSSPAHSGNPCYNDGSWHYGSGWDYEFYVYQDDAVTYEDLAGTVTGSSGASAALNAIFGVAGSVSGSSTISADLTVLTDTELLDSYSESNRDYDDALSIEIWAIGQNFVGDGGTLNSAKFYLKKVGSPAGTLEARIYSYNAGSGIAVNLLATSGSISASTVSTSQELITFTFTGDQKITLTNGTTYVVMVCNPGTTNSYGVDTNCIKVGVDGSSPSHSGHWIDWETWDEETYSSSDLSADVCFYVYKDGTATFVELAGTIAGTSAITGNMNTDYGLSGTVSSSVSVSGLLNATFNMAGNIAATSGISGVLSKIYDLAGSISGASGIAASLINYKELQGAITCLSTLVGNLGPVKSLAGTVTGSSGASAALNAIFGVAGSVSGSSTITGALSIFHRAGYPRISNSLAKAIIGKNNTAIHGSQTKKSALFHFNP